MSERITISNGEVTDADTGEVVAEVAEQPQEDQVDEQVEEQSDAEAVQEEAGEAEEEEWEYEEEEAEDQDSGPLSVDSLNEMSAAYMESGALTDDHYAALEAAGVDRNVVDQVIQGQVALVEMQKAQALFELDLTQSQYQQLADWAGKNWSEDQIETYNRLVDGNDPAARRMAIENLKMQAGARGRRAAVEGSVKAKGVAPFQNTQEMVEAMSDPRYKQRQDPYYSEVRARIAAGG